MNNYKSVYVVTAPSGTGKTTLNKRLILEIPDLEFSISYTTRKKRLGERDSLDYWFVSKEQFHNHIENNEMLEWAEVFGNLYGTSIQEVNRILSKNHKILIEIDVKGWMQLKSKLIKIFRVRQGK